MSANKFIPDGFDPQRVLDGLHKAMGFGEPNGLDPDGKSSAEATFYFQKIADDGLEEKDSSGVPYAVDEPRRNVAAPKHKTAPCAVEYFDALGSMETFGDARPSRIKLTILQPDWETVKTFSWVVANGDKYIRGREEPVVALGSIDVHTIWCTAEGES